MQLVKRSLFTLIFCALSILSRGQSGIPYITYVETREGYEAGNWLICQDDQNAMLFANKRGLLRYDGNEWRIIPLPYMPVSIRKNPFNDVVYIVSDNNYGYLKRDSFGSVTYTPLSYEGELAGGLSDIFFKDSSVIIYGSNLVSIHNSDVDVLSARFSSESYGKFSGIITTPDDVFVNSNDHGLLRISKDTLLETNVTEFSNSEILFSLPFTGNQVLLGLNSGLLKVFNGKTSRPYSISNSEYLTENGLTGGVALTDSTYAFSTLYGGVIIVSKMEGKVLYTLNYNSGLPDDEIYAIGTDENSGLWLTYEFGTCRVDPGLPVRDLSHYPGLEGLITNTIKFNGELYVSTTEGLYYLSEVKNYEEVEVYIKKEMANAPVQEKVSKRSRGEMKEGGRETSRFLKKLFGRNKSEEPAIQTSENDNTQATTPQYYKKKVSKLKSVDYVYKKVKGLNSRCERMYITPYGLLAGSTSGLFLISDHLAELILETRNINYIGDGIPGESCFVCAEEGLFTITLNDGKLNIEKDLKYNEPIFSALLKDEQSWISAYDKVIKVTQRENDTILPVTYNFRSVYPEELFLSVADDTLFLFSSSGIRYYEPEKDSFLVYNRPGFQSADYNSLEYFPSPGKISWLKVDNRIRAVGRIAQEISDRSNLWGLFDNINSFYYKKEVGYLVVDSYSSIYLIDASQHKLNNAVFRLFITSVSNETGELFDPASLKIDPNEKLLRIGVSAPYFLKHQSTLYHYRIEGRMENWSKWSTNSELELYPEPGIYTIQIRAKNILDDISQPVTITFEVQSPFYQTTWFYLLFIPIVLTFIFLFFYIRERKLKRDKRILEEKVQERTLEIQKQKQKIEIQKDEILAQKNDITSSITYASRIQQAILPAKTAFENSFSDYYIFYRPRDIVSGDFYWITQARDKVIFAVADCTGHGVPGAFMSMLGNSFLNEITKDTSIKLSSGEILDELRNKITEALSQSGNTVDAKDGMDIALCIYWKKKQTLEYSGAHNSLILVREKVLAEYKADRMPIGHYPTRKKFRTQTIEVKKNDLLYLFTDGFQDQFGGIHSKKFTILKFKQMLSELSNYPMAKQEELMEKKLLYWQLNNEQVDDILVLGVKI